MDTPYPHTHPGLGEPQQGCPEIPEFRRLRYLYGQLLGVADFQAEQNYHRDKLRLHNRCLHGYGVVCGLLVQPADDPEPCTPAGVAEARALRSELVTLQARAASEQGDVRTGTDAEIKTLLDRIKALPDPDCYPAPPTRISIDCGFGIDCHGNELVMRRKCDFDPWPLVPAEARKQAGDLPVTLWISLCFCEQGIDPVRPVLNDLCGTVSECAYGKVRESVRVIVRLEPPEPDRRCETCCTECSGCCLLLARIECFRPGERLEAGAIDNAVRRRLPQAHRPPTVIKGINWVHGARYPKPDGETILGTNDDAGGIVVQFSRPVLASSFRHGVLELWRIDGGPGRRGNITEIGGHFVELPASGTVTSVRYRQTDEGDLNGGDRVLIQLRCAFILDECCMPVDGAHVGGRVPPLPGTIEPEGPRHEHGCAIPPWGYLPWTSGNGSPGSSFESWFTIAPHEGRAGGPRYGRESSR
jgi:hypothetical protein